MPQHSAYPNNVVYQKGVTAKFLCISHNKVTWTFNERPISNKDMITRTHGNHSNMHTLIIPNFNEDLQGRYMCIWKKLDDHDPYILYYSEVRVWFTSKNMYNITCNIMVI